MFRTSCADLLAGTAPDIDFARHGGGDERGAVFLQAADEQFDFLHQPVDFGRFAVKVGGDGGLFGEKRQHEHKISDLFTRRTFWCS